MRVPMRFIFMNDLPNIKSMYLRKEKVLLCLLYFVVKFIYDSNKQSAKAKHDVIVYDKKKETVSMATINIIFLEQKKSTELSTRNKGIPITVTFITKKRIYYTLCNFL